jgi:hypothetical protein
VNVLEAQALGFATMLGQQAGTARRVGAPVFGFTAPTILYDEIRAIDQDATRLDANVTAYIPLGVPFRAAWSSWLPNWQAFRDKYLDSAYQRLGAVFYTDDLAKQIETYRQQLSALYQDYARQTSPQGGAVPALTPPGPQAPPLVPGQQTDPATGQSSPSLLPWWGWVLLTVGAAGVGYWGYRRFVKPAVGRLFGSEHEGSDPEPRPIARLAAPRDPRSPNFHLARDGYPGARMSGSPEYRTGGRDATLAYAAEGMAVEVEDPSSLLAGYAQDPRALHGAEFWYRPYEHPHVVPVKRRFGGPSFHASGGHYEEEESDDE